MKAAQEKPLPPSEKEIDGTGIKKLDIGCGRNKRPGAIGVDRVNLPGVDIVHDLNKFPYPFQDDCFDEIYATHIIEHLDSIMSVMEEIYRISKSGASVTIVTPHHTDSMSWQDPTHKWHLNSYSFSYFEPMYHTNYYTKACFKVVGKKLEMSALWKYTGFQFLINLDNKLRSFRFIRKFWEQYLCFLLRGKQMTFFLEVLK
jgi:SAM-dependent methyltransferase